MKTEKNRTDQTLAQQMRINDADVSFRKRLLGFTPELEQILAQYDQPIREVVDAVVEDFYLQQTDIPQIQTIIGDLDTLKRLKASMKAYIIRLFSGRYDADYVNSRLRIGKVHARIGVPPKIYVASMHRLEQHVATALSEGYGYDPSCNALSKLMLFDLQLVFDTYIEGLISEVEEARDEVIRYSESLETKVEERTAEIARLARVDDLTGLSNRRHFMRHAEKALQAARDVGKPLSLVFLDLDGFKTVNDSMGHQEGDRALAAVGALIGSLLSKEDMAARYGGDEFCILLPGADAVEARILCAKVQTALTEMPDLELKASFGLASAEPGSYPELDELIAIADGAMYASRQDKAERVEIPFRRNASA